MKKMYWILISLLLGFIASSCSQKLPVPTLEKAGLLVIPTICQNFTPYSYGYYYNFLYKAENQFHIKIVPLGSRNFAVIDGVPPGKYEIIGITSISSAAEGIPDVISETTDFSKSIPLEIKANELTLLPYNFTIEQRFQSPNDVGRYYQEFTLRALTKDQYKQILSDLKSLPNAELYDLTQLSAASNTVSGDGVVSTNKSYRSWRPGRR